MKLRMTTIQNNVDVLVALEGETIVNVSSEVSGIMSEFDSSAEVSIYCLPLYENLGVKNHECPEPSGDVASESALMEISHKVYFDTNEGQSVKTCVKVALEELPSKTVCEKSNVGLHTSSGYGESDQGGVDKSLTSRDTAELPTGVMPTQYGTDEVCCAAYYSADEMSVEAVMEGLVSDRKILSIAKVYGTGPGELCHQTLALGLEHV